MNATLKKVLLISAKNAVNAVLTNGTLLAAMPGVINLHSSDGLWNILKVTIGVVISREAMIWVPVLIKWSTSNGTPQ